MGGSPQSPALLGGSTLRPSLGYPNTKPVSRSPRLTSPRLARRFRVPQGTVPLGRASCQRRWAGVPATGRQPPTDRGAGLTPGKCLGTAEPWIAASAPRASPAGSAAPPRPTGGATACGPLCLAMHSARCRQQNFLRR